MSNLFNFSGRRLLAIILKEIIQTLRDRVTLAMMIGIPVIQLAIFGFAINTNPKHLPAVIVGDELSPYARSIASAMVTSDYFSFRPAPVTEAEAQRLFRRGDIQFALTFPPDFSRELLKGQRPQVLLQADASDPSAVGYAAAAFPLIVSSALQRDLRAFWPAATQADPVAVVIHRCFNPEIQTKINVVPGLLGVILTLTMVIITALAMTREKERGTMEALLATPVRPLEVMIGKIIPYLVVGYLQILLIMFLGKYIFRITVIGSMPLLLFLSIFFIAANLAVGLTISTAAKSQVQAVQMAIFFFLPSILLSGFMFPFRGMPEWAQWIGTILPLTHYLQIVRGIILRGAEFADIADHLVAIIVFMLAVIVLGLFKYRQTLD